jgi:hypothetical protein
MLEPKLQIEEKLLVSFVGLGDWVQQLSPALKFRKVNFSS